MPLFLNEDGRTLGPTARFVWDQIMVGQADVRADAAPGLVPLVLAFVEGVNVRE